MRPGKILLFFIFVIFVLPSFSQIIEDNPKIKSTTEKDLKIESILLYPDKTVIKFGYTKTNQAKGDWIFMAEPGSELAMYLLANDVKYKLVSKTGIGSAAGITQITMNKTVNFVATFEPLPKGVTKFDLIEGTYGGDYSSWCIYGIKFLANKKKK